MPSTFTFTSGRLEGSGHINTADGAFLMLQTNYTMDFSGTVNDLRIHSGYNNTISLSQNLTVLDTLYLTAVNKMQGDTLKVQGDILSNTASNNISFIKAVGTNNQTIDGTGNIKSFAYGKPAGNLTVASGFGTITTFNISDYTYDVDGSSVTATNFYVEDGATLKGTGTLTGKLTVLNGGTLNTGNSAGCLSVTDRFTLSAGSKLISELGGSTACTGYDQLQVGERAYLYGDLEVSLIGGYQPTSSTLHDIITATTAVHNTFASVTTPVGYNATPTYNSTSVQLSLFSNAVDIEVGTDSVCIGENVTVPVNVSNANGVGSFSFRIDFDNTELQLVSNSNNHTHLGNGNFQITDAATANAGGYVTFSWFDGSGVSGKDFGDSKLLDLTFTTLKSGNLDLTWNTSGSNGDITDGLGTAKTANFKDSLAYAYALPTVTLSADDTSVCVGETITFTAGGGTSYEFLVNGVSQGAASATNTFASNTFVNGDEVVVYVTNENGCIDSSAAIAVTIYALPTPTLSADDASVCIGETITFTAGGGVAYEFFVNGGSQGAASATNTFATNSLADGDNVTVEVTNANGCQATSSPVNVTIYALPTPTLTSSDANNEICAGDQVVFTAGGGVEYQFYVNGVAVTANYNNVNTYTTSSLANGDEVDVYVKNANGCIDSSAAIVTTVHALPTPTLTSSDADNLICTGDAVTFTAGGGITYEFLLNETSTGAASATNTYNTSSLADGDAVRVVVTNANGCMDTSSAITTTVAAIPTAQTVNGGGDYCPSAGGTVIGLDGSETGMTYELRLGGAVVETIAGTGSAINFTGVTTTSTTGETYTVTAFNNTNNACTFTMTGTATVTLTCFDVTVNLIYDNGQNQGLKNTTVKLFNSGGTEVGNGTTDNSGQVTIQNITNGTGYYIEADLASKPHGGINATDALLITLDFANFINLTGMKDRAADVDGSGMGNANDALQVNRRYVGNPYTFSADWLHDNDATNAFSVSGANVNMTSLVLAYGDVNGSYDVSGLSNGSKTNINFYNEGEIIAEENTTIEIPFFTKQPLQTGAVSLVVSYPYDVFDIEKVTMNSENVTNLLYEVNDGRLRLTWFNIAPMDLNANEAIFTITAKVHEDLTAAHGWTPTITFGDETELADGTGNVIENVTITVPTIVLPQQTKLHRTNTFSQLIYPNPAVRETTLEYNLINDAQVTIELYDAVGRQVSVLAQENQSAGIYQLLINTSELQGGVYKIRTIVKEGDQVQAYTKQLLIAK
jgi:hypothetical protein